MSPSTTKNNRSKRLKRSVVKEMGFKDDTSPDSKESSQDSEEDGIDLQYVMKSLGEKLQKRVIKKQKETIDKVLIEKESIENESNELFKKEEQELEKVITSHFENKTQLHDVERQIRLEILSTQNALREALNSLSNMINSEFENLKNDEDFRIEQITKLIDHEESVIGDCLRNPNLDGPEEEEEDTGEFAEMIG